MMSQNNLKLMIWTRTYWCIALPYNSGIRQIQSCHVRWLFQLAIPKKNQAKMEPQQHIPGHPHSPLPTWYPIPYHTKVKRLMNSTIHPRLCVAQCLHKFHVPISTGLLIQRVESGYLRFPNIWDQRPRRCSKSPAQQNKRNLHVYFDVFHLSHLVGKVPTFSVQALDAWNSKSHFLAEEWK